VRHDRRQQFRFGEGNSLSRPGVSFIRRAIQERDAVALHDAEERASFDFDAAPLHGAALAKRFMQG